MFFFLRASDAQVRKSSREGGKDKVAYENFIDLPLTLVMACLYRIFGQFSLGDLPRFYVFLDIDYFLISFLVPCRLRGSCIDLVLLC